MSVEQDISTIVKLKKYVNKDGFIINLIMLPHERQKSTLMLKW